MGPATPNAKQLKLLMQVQRILTTFLHHWTRRAHLASFLNQQWLMTRRKKNIYRTTTTFRIIKKIRTHAAFLCVAAHDASPDGRLNMLHTVFLCDDDANDNPL
jgi:hypothetical protein